MRNIQAALANPPGGKISLVEAPPRAALGPWASSCWAIAFYLLGGVPMLVVALALTRDVPDAWRLFSEPEGVWRPLLHIGEDLCTIGVLALALHLFGFRIAEYLALARPRGRFVTATLACAALAIVIPFLIPAPASGQAPDSVAMASGSTVFWSFLAISVSAPLWEELLFRGFLYRGLSQSRLDAAGAILVTAVAWGLLHGWKGPLGIGETAVVGVAWGWLRVYTGSALAPIAAHVLNNGFFTLLALAMKAGWIS